MPEFFKGWKRKAGCVTLVMACAFGLGWIRSVLVGDRVWFENTFGIQLVESRLGRLAWARWVSPDKQSRISIIFRIDPTGNYPAVPERVRWKSFGASSAAEDDIVEDQFRRSRFRWRLGDFSIGHQPAPWSDVVTCYSIPYWSIVLPLTLFSAWLLLSKQPSVKRPVEPPKDQP